MADTNSQKEYNEVLKVTQSMLGDIKDSMSDIASESDKRNKKLSNEVSINKKILSDLGEKENYSKKINQIEQQIERVSKSNYGVNQKYKQTLLAQLDAQQESLRSAQSMKQVTEKVNDVADNVGSSFKNTFDGIQSSLESIPIFGKMLGKTFEPLKESANRITDVAAHKFKTRFQSSFISAKEGGASFTKSLSSGLQGGTRAAINFGKSAVKMLGPVGVAVLLIGSALLIGVKRFQELDKAAKKFREETGLLNSQTQGLVQNIQTVSRDLASVGASAEDVASAASAFTQEFDNLQQPSQGVLSSVVAMEKSFGVSAANQAKVNEQFQRMAGVSAETAQSMIQTTVQAAKLAGVAPSQVMADIAENSEASFKFFNGSPQALAKAAVEAAKLGTSIGEAAELSGKLLDFESSINAELNASAMLGTNLNFNEARRLAANKDILGAQQAVVKEVSKLGDLTKLSVFEQEALAEAAGMPIEDLIKQQQIQQNLGDLGENQLAAANKLIAAGMEAKDITSEQLNEEAKRIAQQNELQSQTEKLQNSFSALSVGLQDVFMPVVNFVMPLINDLIDIVSSILMPAFKILGAVFKVTFGILSAVVQPIFALFKALVGAVMEPFSRIGDALQPLGDKFAELKDKVMPFLEPLINIMKSIGNILGNVVGGAIGLVVDTLMFLFSTAFSIFSSIAGFINTYLIEPIMSFVNGIGSVISSVASLFGGGGEAAEAGTQSAGPTETAVTAVGPDVAMAEGGIVDSPTNALIGEAGPEAVVPLDKMFDKFDEMISVFRQTKDVYMDGKKVTSGVNRVVDSVGTNTYSLG